MKWRKAPQVSQIHWVTFPRQIHYCWFASNIFHHWFQNNPAELNKPVACRSSAKILATDSIHDLCAFSCVQQVSSFHAATSKMPTINYRKAWKIRNNFKSIATHYLTLCCVCLPQGQDLLICRISNCIFYFLFFKFSHPFIRFTTSSSKFILLSFFFFFTKSVKFNHLLLYFWVFYN